MFQEFTTTSDPSQGPARLAALRAAMAERGVAGVIVPLADAHQGEYVAPCDARLAWLTGFTGSAGFAVVLADIAGVFIDGRYRVQVRDQVDLAHFTPVPWPETQSWDWLRAHLSAGKIAYDPWLHGIDEIAKLRQGLEGSELVLAPGPNLVDQIWPDRPARPDAPARAHPLAFAGQSSADKRAALAEGLRAQGQAAAALTQTDSLCWLLNLRGSDIPRNPVMQGFALLHSDASVDLFTDAPMDEALLAELGAEVRRHPREAFLAQAQATEGAVLLDRATAPQLLQDALAQPVLGDDPCALPKACKNETEIAGARAAHLRDGAAVVEFLTWLEANADQGLDEITITKHLEQCRHQSGQLLELSFDTICGAGPHGAIVHYRVTETTNRAIAPGELLLVDSGGQYQDGTTDLTRTIAIGTPDAAQRRCYTRVLQGVIAIHRARFPRGVAGAHLDALARAPLWMDGLDYDHGTGHGVGSYLCVHEGPQRLSRASTVALAPGMILSNEPGYYREGAFGIRIENLVVVRAAPPVPDQDGRDWLDFENLTFVPLDRRLIDLDLLSREERAWIDAYHASTLAQIGPRVGADAQAWLARACAPL